MTFINYFSGLWIFIPFTVLCITHSFVFSKREKEFDILLFSVILAFAGLMTYQLSPYYMGTGLRLMIKQNTTNIYLILFSITSFLVIVYGLLEKDPKTTAKNIINNSKKLIGYIQSKNESTDIEGSRKRKMLAATVGTSAPKINLKPKLKSIFNRSTELFDKVKVKRTTEINNNETVNYETQLIEASIERKPILNKIERKLEVPVQDISDGNKNEEAPINKADKRIFAPKKNVEFFKSGDLIDCISQSSLNTNNHNPDQQYFVEIVDSLEEKFEDFKLSAKVVNILKGPVVDTFEVELGPGVKVSKIISITKDLTLALRGAPVRIVSQMKGKSTVGIEVPRSPREIIFLDEVLKDEKFINSKYRLPVAMGKNAFGEPTTIDLAGCPHMLVAGSTGAGKSVFINTLLVSLLVKMSPDKMKLILIDPKQLELALYQSLPHLILPVVTEPSKAGAALLWACQEMDRRYSVMKDLAVRNIEGFNEKVKRLPEEDLIKIHHYYEGFEDDGFELPYIVIIVDEFADLVLSKDGKAIENSICRLAAKARACGIHIVLATQRPSVDVITGLIKANFPTRVSFRVSGVNDSRTILNAGGAEMLLGMGDMLYKHGIETIRLHSSFVQEDEIEQLTEKLGEIKIEFNTKAMDFLENGGPDVDGVHVSFGGSTRSSKQAEDARYDEAVGVAMEYRKVSASFLQRKMSIGYNRAAKIIELMEDRGIVGPQQGSKPRKVLIGGE
jgi:S-DNA-T family DNA segregation ATPase FtsK/SpoIIIE